MRTPGVDGESVSSFFSSKQLGARPPQCIHPQWPKSPTKVNEEAFLKMREEWMQAKQREVATEDKVRQLTAQLARTEEAAKRILIKTDDSARGGTAQRLLDAERELAGMKASKAEVESELERLKRVAADWKRQAGEAKKRLEVALSDQRRLALKVGKLESAHSQGLLHPADAVSSTQLQISSSPSPGQNEPNSEAARRFAAQQEALAAARREVQALQSAAQEAETRAQQRFGNLVRGLEGGILALSRKLQAYEHQLAVLGVPLPGPYPETAGQGQNPLLGVVDGGLADLPQIALWILEEWLHGGCLYLRDPLAGGVYSYTSPQEHGPSGWPQPVGIFSAGGLLAAPAQQALKLFLSLGEVLAGQPVRAQALHQPLMQASGCLEAAAGVLERAVQHRVAHSDVAALLACLGTDTAAVLQPAAFAASLQEIAVVAEAVAGGNCRQLKTVQQKVHRALGERGEEAARFLLARAAAPAGSSGGGGGVQYYHLVEWLRMVVPGLSSEEVWAALLWLRTWDLHASGSIWPCIALRAFCFGAIWRIPPVAATGGPGGVRASIEAARSLERQLGAGAEVARLETTLKEREGELARKGKEVKALEARLREVEAALQCSLEQQQRLQQRSDGEGAGAEAEAGRLRMEYLKAKGALESAAACNARLVQELEESKAELQELRSISKQQPHHRSEQLQPSPGKENGACLDRRPEPPALPAVLQQGARAPSIPMLAPEAPAPGLQQQLAQARHSVAQLQIELDAAQAKLEIYRAAQNGGEAGNVCIKAVHAKPQDKPTSPRVERIGTKPGPDVNRRGMAAAAPSSPMQSKGRQLMQPTPEELKGLGEHESIIELHVHAASLAPHALGPQAMTFLSLDFYQHETQLTPIREGATPVFNTTLQFVVSMEDYLLTHLAEGSLRVELHACQLAAPGAGVEYATVARGSIPLAQLLEGSAEAKLGPQQCTLVGEAEQVVGTLEYALCALRPICAHPHANTLHKAGRRASSCRPEQTLSCSQGHDAAEAGEPMGQAQCGSNSSAPFASGFDSMVAANGCASLPDGAWQPTAAGNFPSGDGYQEITRIRYMRVESPSPQQHLPAPAGQQHLPDGGRSHAGEDVGEEGGSGSGRSSLRQGSSCRGPHPTSQPKERLRITGLACRDLRVTAPSTAQPYLCLTWEGPAAGSGRGSSNNAAGHLHSWLHETRPVRGPNPSFGDEPVVVELPGQWEPKFGAVQAAGHADCSVRAVVFDAGVDAERDPAGGVVGVGRVPLPPLQGLLGGRRMQSIPLVHPATGRHAGVLELQLEWE